MIVSFGLHATASAVDSHWYFETLRQRQAAPGDGLRRSPHKHDLVLR